MRHEKVINTCTNVNHFMNFHEKEKESEIERIIIIKTPKSKFTQVLAFFYSRKDQQKSFCFLFLFIE